MIVYYLIFFDAIALSILTVLINYQKYRLLIIKIRRVRLIKEFNITSLNLKLLAMGAKIVSRQKASD